MPKRKADQVITRAEKDTKKSKLDLEKSIRETAYKKDLAEKRAWRDKQQQAAQAKQAEIEQRAAVARQPAEKEQAARAEAAYGKWQGLSTELVESGIQGFDRFDTSVSKVIQLSKAGGHSLSENYPPWKTIRRAIASTPWALGKAADAVGGAIQKIGDTSDDWRGSRQTGATEPLYEGDIDFGKMVTVKDGNLDFGTFAKQPSFEGTDPERIRLTDELFKNIMRLKLLKEGWREDKDTSGKPCWKMEAETGPYSVGTSLKQPHLDEIFTEQEDIKTLEAFYNKAAFSKPSSGPEDKDDPENRNGMSMR